MLRFNGAAPMRARKYQRLCAGSSKANRFNGAAPVRARKLIDNAARFSGVDALQRSRARESAEMALASHRFALRREASTEPRP